MDKKRSYLSLLIVFLVAVMASASFAAKTELGKWMGRHTRLVWVQDQGGGGDTFARSKKLMLYGYDSKDGRGERPLVPRRGNFFKPLFTPDGNSVVVSNRNKRKMFLVDWESGKIKELGPGVAVAVWEEVTTSFFIDKKQVWVYCFIGLQPENKYGTGQPLYRFPLDKPEKKELIWKSTNMAWSSIQLSRDGKLIGGLFPWPDGGVLHTKTKKFQRLGRGCWTSLSPDNSKLLWIFDGLHRNIQIYNVDRNKSWKVNINGAPGIDGFEVYHPRWSNHPRYFVLTGPYKKGEGGNRIGGGGEKVEVYIGRFDDEAKSVEDWFQVTRNNRADFYPELWVEDGSSSDLDDSLAFKGTETEREPWPVARANLVFLWENMKAENQLDKNSPVGFHQCNLELHGHALHSKDYQLIATGGWAESSEGVEKIGGALADTGKASIEVTITPQQIQSGQFFTFMGETSPQLQLTQKGLNLEVMIQGSDDQVQRATWADVFSPGQTTSVSFNLYANKTEVFVDGQSLGSKNIQSDFSKMDIRRLILGNLEGKWSGALENIAIFSRVLNGLAIRRNSDLVQKKVAARNSVDQLRLEGELLERSEIPDPDAIGAYSRALVVNSYLVKRLELGEYPGDRILVAEWAVLDRKIVKKYNNSVETELLVLEKFDQHPELEGERQMMDIFEPDLELYYRVPVQSMASTAPDQGLQ